MGRSAAPVGSDCNDVPCGCVCCVASPLSHPTAATLFQVPNAPIVFANDPTHQKRVEDGIIAFTFVSFVANQSDTSQVCVCVCVCVWFLLGGGGGVGGVR